MTIPQIRRGGKSRTLEYPPTFNLELAEPRAIIFLELLRSSMADNTHEHQTSASASASGDPLNVKTNSNTRRRWAIGHLWDWKKRGSPWRLPDQELRLDDR